MSSSSSDVATTENGSEQPRKGRQDKGGEARTNASYRGNAFSPFVAKPPTAGRSQRAYVPPHARNRNVRAAHPPRPATPSQRAPAPVRPGLRWSEVAGSDPDTATTGASVSANTKDTGDTQRQDGQATSPVPSSSSSSEVPRPVATRPSSANPAACEATGAAAPPGELHTENPHVKRGGVVMNAGIDFDKYDAIPVEVTGGGPLPLARFADAGLAPVIMRNVELAGYDRPTPVQKYALPIVAARTDLMACAQTGSGKTAAFLLPILSAIEADPPSVAAAAAAAAEKGRRQRGGGGGGGFRFDFGAGGRRPLRSDQAVRPRALVLAPTRELADQIHGEAQKFAYRSAATVGLAYGGKPMREQVAELRRSGAAVLIATPGRLGDLMEQGWVALGGVRHLVLDEADRMLDMGFEPQIRSIVEGADMPPAGDRCTLLFSATFPDAIQRMAADFMRDYLFLRVGRVGGATQSIEQRVLPVEPRAKFDALTDALHEVKGLTLVFVGTKRCADEVALRLRERHGLPAAPIHGDLGQAEREHALAQFRAGRLPILVATDVAARGLDIPNVLHVVNYDMPNNIDDYVHRIGRTGRAGNKGLATAFVSERDPAAIAAALRKVLDDAQQEVPQWLAMRADRCPVAVGGRRDRGRDPRFGGSDLRARGRAQDGAPRPSDHGGDGGNAMAAAAAVAASVSERYAWSSKSHERDGGTSTSVWDD